MWKAIGACIGSILLVMACIAAFITSSGYTKEKPTRFQPGECLRMNWDGVESWFDNITARVEHVGKENYGVRYWFDYGWSQGEGTWPFSLPSVKVVCPTETKGDLQ